MDSEKAEQDRFKQAIPHHNQTSQNFEKKSTDSPYIKN